MRNFSFETKNQRKYWTKEQIAEKYYAARNIVVWDRKCKQQQNKSEMNQKKKIVKLVSADL